MLTSMMAFPEFYKKHMKLFIAIAPVMYLNNMDAEIFKLLNNDKNALKLLKSLGPELFPDSAAVHP